MILRWCDFYSSRFLPILDQMANSKKVATKGRKKKLSIATASQCTGAPAPCWTLKLRQNANITEDKTIIGVKETPLPNINIYFFRKPCNDNHNIVSAIACHECKHTDAYCNFAAIVKILVGANAISVPGPGAPNASSPLLSLPKKCSNAHTAISLQDKNPTSSYIVWVLCHFFFFACALDYLNIISRKGFHLSEDTPLTKIGHGVCQTL